MHELHELTYYPGKNTATGKYLEGRDANNHIVSCACGWAFSSTYLAVRKRATQHCDAFRDERRAWNDPKRQTKMPEFYSFNCAT